jgi:hypothetical protein
MKQLNKTAYNFSVSLILIPFLGADYMDRATPVNRAEKCHENLPWAAK